MEAKSYIVEISVIDGDETLVYLEADGQPVESLYAVVAIAERGACIIDNCYRSIGEAQKAWPEAIPPTPQSLTPSAIAKHFTISGRVADKKIN